MDDPSAVPWSHHKVCGPDDSVAVWAESGSKRNVLCGIGIIWIKDVCNLLFDMQSECW